MVDGHQKQPPAVRVAYQNSLAGKLIGSACTDVLLFAHSVPVGWVNKSETTQFTNGMATRRRRRIVFPADSG